MVVYESNKLGKLSQGFNISAVYGISIFMAIVYPTHR